MPKEKKKDKDKSKKNKNKEVAASSKEEKKEVVAVKEKNKLLSYMNGLLNVIEAKAKVAQFGFNSKKLPTGMLSVDWVLGGGLSVGITNFAGIEGSGKSTLSASVLKSALEANILTKLYFDPENSVDPVLTKNILRVHNLTDVFGKKDPKGNYVTEPLCHYYTDDLIETVFDIMVKVLNRMPDKVFRSDLNQWYYVIDSNDKKLTPLKNVLGKPDGKLSKEGRLWFPAEDGELQGVFFVDSWPQLLTEDIDEKESATNAMAAEARALSKHLKRVRGKLRRKNVIIVGVNQLSEIPGVMFGPKTKEKGGRALAHATNCRNELESRAVPSEWKSETHSQWMQEPSVEGGDDDMDKYQFKFFKNTKNKNSTPFGQTSMRIWISDHKGEGRGFDPVYDTAQFLYNIGIAKRVSGGKNVGSNAVHFYEHKKYKHVLSGKTIPWLAFKTLVLAETDTTPELEKAAKAVRKEHGIKNDLFIRQWCKELMSSGKAKELSDIFKSLPKEDKKGKKKKGESDDMED